MQPDYFKNITLQQMEALLCLVREGNFSRAAAKMSLTQPALTKNIKNIEELLGVNGERNGVASLIVTFNA